MSTSLLEKMRVIFTSNAALMQLAQADPVMLDFLDNGSGMGSFVYGLYTRRDLVAAVPELRDPQLLMQIENEVGFSKMGRGSIFSLAGVQEHASFNGTVRPVIQL